MKLRSPIPPRRARLEIIPLIDVMFFLLASFMMVSLTMTKQQTLKVNLPVAAASHSDLKSHSVTLRVNASGDIYLGEELQPLPDLERRLAGIHRRNPATPVYISADAETRHRDTIRAVDAARSAGFTKVAFNVKPATP